MTDDNEFTTDFLDGLREVLDSHDPDESLEKMTTSFSLRLYTGDMTKGIPLNAASPINMLVSGSMTLPQETGADEPHMHVDVVAFGPGIQAISLSGADPKPVLDSMLRHVVKGFDEEDGEYVIKDGMHVNPDGSYREPPEDGTPCTGCGQVHS